MTTELLKEPQPDELSASPSKADQRSMGDAGRSLFDEVKLLREQVADLCKATKALVHLQSIANQKLDVVLKGGLGADVGVL